MHYQQQKLFKGVKQQVMHFFPNATLNINTVHYPWFSTQVILTGVDLKIPYQGEDKKTIYQYYRIGRFAFDVHQQDNNMSMTANKVNIRWDEKDISIDNLRFANLLVNHQFIQKVQTNINDIDWSQIEFKQVDISQFQLHNNFSEYCMVLDEYHADDYGLNHKTNQIFKGFQYRSCGKHQDEFLQKFKFLEIKKFDISGYWNAQYNMKSQEWVLDSLSLTDKNMGELNLKIKAIVASEYHDIFIILGLFIDAPILEQYPIRIINFDLSFDALPWVKRIMEVNSKKTHQNIADTTNQWVNFYLQDMKEGSFIDKQWDDALINILKGKAKTIQIKVYSKIPYDVLTLSKEYKHLDDLSESVKDREFELQSEKEEMLENKRKLKEIMYMIHIQAISYMGKDKDD